LPRFKSETILNQKGMIRAITRIAHEILERNNGADTLAIVGIFTRGASLAKRIAEKINQIEGVDVPVGFLDINLYRDDVRSKLDQPIIQRTEILFDIVDRNIILVDDVLFTGRTIRSALDALIDFGRPRSIQLAVLVDRGHRELPIRPDYVGKNIPTSKDDKVQVKFEEIDKEDVVIFEKLGMKKESAANKGGKSKSSKRGDKK
jgi:pyrimidine operon attenuation protein / uracil phosphoribosyltransferase